MFDLPTSPAIGTIASGRIWDGTYWNKPNLALPVSLEPPKDTKEYVMLNGVWQPKREAKTTLPADFVPPALAKAFRFRVSHNVVTTGTLVQLCMQFSIDGGATFKNGNFDYWYAGPVHYTGTAAYGGYLYSQTSVIPVTVGTNHANVPTWGSGMFLLKRASGDELTGFATGNGYIEGAANLWGRFHLRVGGAITTFSGTTAPNVIRFFSSGAGVSINHFVVVDWIY